MPGTGRGDVLLRLAIIAGFLTELALLSVHALLMHGTLAGPSIVTAWPVFEATLLLISRLLLAAAFLRRLLAAPPKSQSLLALGLGMALLSLLAFALTWRSNAVDTQTMLSFAVTYSWLIHAVGAGLLALTVVLLARRLRSVMNPAVAGFTLLLASSLILTLSRFTAPATQGILEPVTGNLSLWAIPVLGYATCRIGRISDRTVRKRILNSQRLEAMGQLSSGIAHDFNNHLQIILGYVELARSQHSDPVSAATSLSRIEEAAEAAGELVKQLLTFSRSQKIDYAVLDLNAVIMGVVPMVSRLLGPDTHLTLDLDTRVRPITGDRRMIEQALFNLVINARDAMTKGGIITIRTCSTNGLPPGHLSAVKHSADKHSTEKLSTDKTGVLPGNWTRVTVADTGKGMDQATLNRAFEPFFTTKAAGNGTGLGLASVYGILQDHGAGIQIDTRPGLFTRVNIDFPGSPEPVATRTARASARRRGNGECVMLIEDDAAIREMIRTLLATSGYRIVIASDADNAIQLIDTDQSAVDLCLFNATLPRQSGYQIYERICKAGFTTPVLFITDATSTADRQQIQHPHLQKPFTSTQLLNGVWLVLHPVLIA